MHQLYASLTVLNLSWPIVFLLCVLIILRWNEISLYFLLLQAQREEQTLCNRYLEISLYCIQPLCPVGFEAQDNLYLIGI